MIKRGLALSLVLGLASIAQAGAVVDLVPPCDPCAGGATVTVDILLNQDTGSDVYVRLAELHMDDTDPALVLSNFQWAFGAVGHYKDEDLAGGPAGVACAYYYEVVGDLGPNPGAQLLLPADGSQVLIGAVDVTLPLADGAYTLDVMNADESDPDLNAVVAFGFDLGDDPVTSWRAFDGNLTGGQVAINVGSAAISYVSSAPAGALPGEALASTLPRLTDNIVKLTFSGNVPAVPAAGEIEINELLAAGGFGADLSASFSFAIDGGDPTVLVIQDTSNTLQNETWYAIRNLGAWAGVSNFEVQYALVYGDSDDNARTDALDVNNIWLNRGDPAPPDSRQDVDANGRVDALDVNSAWLNRNSAAPAKPAGH